MTLIDEKDEFEFQERKKKVFKTIITAIIALLVIMFILIIYMKISNNMKIKLKINGNNVQNFDSSLILKDKKGNIVDENGEIYISVQKLASMLNYQFYNGTYKRKNEDLTECQIKIQNQITSYKTNSNKIYKTFLYENEDSKTKKESNSINNEEIVKYQEEFEYFELPNSVKYINDTIYVSKSAIELGFDVCIEYSKKEKKIDIYTLENLEKIALNNRKKDAVSSSEYDYINKRLLKYGMVIVKEPSSDNIGVGCFSNEEKLDSYVASCKYKSIKFNEATNTLECISASDGKKCIISVDLINKDVKNTITTHYSDIKQIDNEFKYFLVTDEDKKGIIDIDGKIIVYPAFEEIGVDDSKYLDINNKYILNNKYIPVKQNGLWGLYSTEAKKLIDPKYNDIGCNLNQSGDGIIIIPNIKNGEDAVVFMYNAEQKLYGLYSTNNGEQIAISLVEVFKKYENGKENYYINHTINKENSIIHTLNVHNDM